jgi:hypothetical protein
MNPPQRGRHCDAQRDARGGNDVGAARPDRAPARRPRRDPHPPPTPRGPPPRALAVPVLAPSQPWTHRSWSQTNALRGWLRENDGRKPNQIKKIGSGLAVTDSYTRPISIQR